MADIVGRGQVRLLLPYVRGTGGLPPHTYTVLHPRLSALRHPTFSTFRNDTSSTGPDTGGTQARRSSCGQGGAGVRLPAVWDRHQYLDVKGQVCEQRINGVPDRWRSVAW